MLKLFAGISAVSAVFGAGIMLFIMFSISYGALTRTFNLPSPIWIVQINEYSLVWVCFLATAWVLAENKHVRVDILMTRFGQRKQTILLFIQDTVSTAPVRGLLLSGRPFHLGAPPGQGGGRREHRRAQGLGHRGDSFGISSADPAISSESR